MLKKSFSASTKQCGRERTVAAAGFAANAAAKHPLGAVYPRREGEVQRDRALAGAAWAGRCTDSTRQLIGLRQHRSELGQVGRR